MAVHSQSLLQIFPSPWPGPFDSIREGFQSFILFRTSRRIYWHSHQQYLTFVLMSDLLHQLSHSHSSFSSSCTLILSSSIFFSSAPPSSPVVRISRTKRKAPAWIEPLIIFSSRRANCPVAVHIWSEDNWIVPYLRDLLTFHKEL